MLVGDSILLLTAFEIPFVTPIELDAPDTPLVLAAVSVAVPERRVISTSVKLERAALEAYVM